MLNINTTIGQLMENKEAREVLANASPQLIEMIEQAISAGGQGEMIKGIAIPMLAQFKPDLCSKEVMATIDEKLQAL